MMVLENLIFIIHVFQNQVICILGNLLLLRIILQGQS